MVLPNFPWHPISTVLGDLLTPLMMSTDFPPKLITLDIISQELTRYNSVRLGICLKPTGVVSLLFLSSRTCSISWPRKSYALAIWLSFKLRFLTLGGLKGFKAVILFWDKFTFWRNKSAPASLKKIVFSIWFSEALRVSRWGNLETTCIYYLKNLAKRREYRNIYLSRSSLLSWRILDEYNFLISHRVIQFIFPI